MCDCNASALLQLLLALAVPSMLSCFSHHIGRWDPSSRRSLRMKLCNLLLFFIYRSPFDHTPAVARSLCLCLFLLLFLFSSLLHLLQTQQLLIYCRFTSSNKPRNHSRRLQAAKRLSEIPRPDHSRFSDTPGNTFQRSLTQTESVRLDICPRPERYATYLRDYMSDI